MGDPAVHGVHARVVALGAWSVAEPLVGSPPGFGRWRRSWGRSPRCCSATTSGAASRRSQRRRSSSPLRGRRGSRSVSGTRHVPLVPLAVMSRGADRGPQRRRGSLADTPILAVVLVVFARVMNGRKVAIRAGAPFAAARRGHVPAGDHPGRALAADVVPADQRDRARQPLSTRSASCSCSASGRPVTSASIQAPLTTTYILIAVVGVAALIGVVLAIRARSWALLVYGGGAVVASARDLRPSVLRGWAARRWRRRRRRSPLIAAAGGAALFASRPPRGRRGPLVAVPGPSACSGRPPSPIATSAWRRAASSLSSRRSAASHRGTRDRPS